MGQGQSVADSWSIIERKLGSLMNLWPPGISAAEIAAGEQALGVVLPPDYRESIAIHNGSSTYLGSYEFSSLEEVVHDARMFDEIVASLGPPRPGHVRALGPVRPQRWNRMWVPVVRTSSAHSLVLDLDPLPGGNVGQVVEITHEMNVVTVRAPSFAAWLQRFAEQLATDANPLF